LSTRRQFGRIRRLPSGRWQARYPDHANTDVPAPVTFSTKADAGRFLARVQTEQERGEWRDPRLGEVTFATWVEDWLEGNPAKRATTRARDESVLNTHFVPTLGTIPLARITPADVRRTVDAMASNLAQATVRTNVGVVRAVFNSAVDADLIARSPVRGIRIASREAKRRPILTPDELLELAAAIGPRSRALVLVAGVLGLRWSEAIGLRLDDVDFTAGTITVHQTIAEVAGGLEIAPTKSRASRRTMSVPRFLLDEIADHIERLNGRLGPEDLLFTGPKGGMLRRSFAARTFTPAVAAAGLDPALTFHGLRHVATSLMVEAGEHPRVIQQRLGHASARLSMELYAHVPEVADREVAAHLNERFSVASRADAPACAETPLLGPEAMQRHLYR
jgi:integrase